MKWNSDLWRPEKVITVEPTQLHITPHGHNSIPAGVEGRYFAHNDCYIFDYYDGYSSYLLAKVVLTSDRFKIL